MGARLQIANFRFQSPDCVANSTKLRWYLKKVARYSVMFFTWASGWLILRGCFARGPRVRALMYHRFRDDAYDPFSVTVADFRRQMEWLARSGLAISLADLQAFLAGERDLPDGSVLVTVDDGYYDLWPEIVPLLRQIGVPAVAFVPAGEVAENSGGAVAAAPEDQKLSWREIVALPDQGVAVGSHAWHHRSLGKMAIKQAYFEAIHSRQELQRRLRAPVLAFAYPFGTQADFNSETREILRQAGYACAFTAQHGAIRRGIDPYSLPRVKVEGGEGLWAFKLLVRGGLDGWSVFDRVLWRLQQSGA